MPRILIAEPSKTLAALVKLSLADLGAELEVTYDGTAALASARMRLPDALVCDQALPGLDGYALAHSIKQLASEAGHAPIPVLLIVAEHVAADPERLAYVGIGDVLPKPFERAVLLERVRALFDPTPAALRGDVATAAQALPTIAPPPPTSPFLRPPYPAGALGLPSAHEAPAPALSSAELEARVAAEVGLRLQLELEPLLAKKLPALLDAAVQRLLPSLILGHIERAVAERVPPIVQDAVQRTLAELATPTTIQRIVSDDAKTTIGQVATRLEARLEEQLFERLDRYAREVLPAKLQTHAEQIIWKIVPTLAEDIVKDEIKRLTQEIS